MIVYCGVLNLNDPSGSPAQTCKPPTFATLDPIQHVTQQPKLSLVGQNWDAQSQSYVHDDNKHNERCHSCNEMH